MNDSNNYDQLLSKIIDFLRFPLIVGVIFIHNYNSTILVEGKELGSSSFMPTYYYISNLFSEVIGRLSVPTFFFISGLLFFWHSEFNYNVYNKKIKKRIHTLLIPYVFWNLLHLILYYIIYRLYTNWVVGTDYNFCYIIKSLWGSFNIDGIITSPISYQFWFIRDLMIMIIISPIIHYIISRFKYIIIIPFIIWFLNYNFPYIGSAGISSCALFFFTLGAFYSIHNYRLLFQNPRATQLITSLYIIIAICDLFTKNLSYNLYIHNFGIIIGLYMLFNILVRPMKKGIIKNSFLLSSASFFIFAVHEPYILSQLKKIIYKNLQPNTDLEISFLYFLIVFATVIISLIIYKFFKKICPSFLKVITGGR